MTLSTMFTENNSMVSRLIAEREQILDQQQSASHWLTKAFNKTKLENLSIELAENTSRLGDMLVLGVSPEEATLVMEALGRNYNHDMYQDINNLGILNDIEQTDFTGSRGYGKQVSKGYFSATSDTLGDVVLYRGDFEGYEQARLVHFMNTLDEDVRASFPEIHGVCVQDDKTYLVMEKLCNRQNSLSLSGEAFLEKFKDYLKPSFADHISTFGLNVSNTTIEYDYLFRDDTGDIHLGIPYRAFGFVTDAKERMFSEAAFKNNASVNTHTHHVTSMPV